MIFAGNTLEQKLAYFQQSANDCPLDEPLPGAFDGKLTNFFHSGTTSLTV
jgi:hypothetical protein